MKIHLESPIVPLSEHPFALPSIIVLSRYQRRVEAYRPSTFKRGPDPRGAALPLKKKKGKKREKHKKRGIKRTKKMGKKNGEEKKRRKRKGKEKKRSKKRLLSNESP